jgi:hypothetical protein
MGIEGDTEKKTIPEARPEEVLADVQKIGEYIRSAQFQKAVSILQTKLVGDVAMTEETVQFFNECLIYSLFKLREFKNAETLSEQVTSKI